MMCYFRGAAAIGVWRSTIVFRVCSSSLFFFKQKTAYEMRISDWSSDVCSSDLSITQDAVPAFASITQNGDGNDSSIVQTGTASGAVATTLQTDRKSVV